MIRFIVLMIIGAIIFLIMRIPLATIERLIMKTLSPHNNHIATALASLPSYSPPKASPPKASTTQSTTPSVVSPADEYLAYKNNIRHDLISMWNAVPTSAIDSAMTNPADVLDPGASKPDWWTTKITSSVAAEMSATYGLPPAILSALLTPEDMEDAYSMINAHAAAATLADVWNNSCQNMSPATFVAAHKTLARRGRPAKLIPAYVNATINTLASSRSLPPSVIAKIPAALISHLQEAAVIESSWIPLRLRAGDC